MCILKGEVPVELHFPEWYEKLKPEEGALFRRLGVFVLLQTFEPKQVWRIKFQYDRKSDRRLCNEWYEQISQTQ